MKQFVFWSLAAVLGLSACSSDDGAPVRKTVNADKNPGDDTPGDLVPESVDISLSPKTVTLLTGRTVAFTATVSGADDKGVSWSVKEGASGGSVDANGLYKAPGLPGTFHVVATSKADTTKKVTATITVNKVEVTLDAPAAELYGGESVSFTATVSGTDNREVSWEADGGSIDNGTYTAPETPGTYTIRAISLEDAQAVASATVDVLPPVLLVSPAASELVTGATLAFSSLIRGYADQGVTWFVPNAPHAGTITTDAVYTAPMTEGAYTVIATSSYDSALTAAVTLTVVPRAHLTLDPQTVDLLYGDSRQFTSLVENGRGGETVIFGVDEGAAGGFVTESGLYTAPLESGTFHVRASTFANAEHHEAVAVVNVCEAFVDTLTFSDAGGEQTGAWQLLTRDDTTVSFAWLSELGIDGLDVVAHGIDTVTQKVAGGLLTWEAVYDDAGIQTGYSSYGTDGTTLQQVTFTLDEEGYPIAVSFDTDATAPAEYTAHYTWNAGNVQRIDYRDAGGDYIQGMGYSLYSYPEAGVAVVDRYTMKTGPTWDGNGGGNDRHAQSLRYEYDESGNLVRRVLTAFKPNGSPSAGDHRVHEFSYDGEAKLTTVTVKGVGPDELIGTEDDVVLENATMTESCPW